MKQSNTFNHYIYSVIPPHVLKWQKIIAISAATSTILFISIPVIKMMIHDTIRKYCIIKEKLKRIIEYLSYNIKKERRDFEDQNHSYVHRSIICSNCEFPIVGVRYKCLNCPKYNLCSNCEKKAEYIHFNELHIFIKIYIPIPPLMEFPVLPVLYPGKPSESMQVPYDLIVQLSYETHCMYNHFNILSLRLILIFVVTTQEIHELFSQFKTLCVGNVIPKSVFIKCLGPLKPTNIIAINLYHLFRDPNEEGITFYSFVKVLSVLTRGTLEEKAELALKGYETDESGYISKEQLYNMVLAELNARKDSVLNEIDQFDRSSRDIRDHIQSEFSTYNSLFSATMKKRKEKDETADIDLEDSVKHQKSFKDYIDLDKLNLLETLYLKTAEDITEESFKNVLSKNGKVSKDDFLNWIKKDDQLVSWIEFGKHIF